MNNVNGFVNAALGEKENGVRLNFVAVIVRHAEPIKRNRRITGIDRDQVAIAFALREDPARFADVRKMRAAIRVRNGFADFFLFRIEQAKMRVRQRVPGSEREQMQRDPSRVALPDRTDIGQLNDGLGADPFLFSCHRID